MAKDIGSRQPQLRQIIAQRAARIMAEEGVSDYAFAKKKAGRQLGITEAACLPTNTEVEEEIRLFHEIYHSDNQPEALRQLRQDALIVMQLLERFNPHLTGSVLDGTAGRYAETSIHLFADNTKEVEIFLLNSQVPYETDEKSYRMNNDKKSGARKKVPVFILEGPNGIIKLSVFGVDDACSPPKRAANDGNKARLDTQGLMALINTATTLNI